MITLQAQEYGYVVLGSVVKRQDMRTLSTKLMITARTKSLDVASKLFFLKRRQNLCLDLLIKKKRVVQLIYKKPDENQYNEAPQTTHKTRNSHR
jgi:hypothetical protein